MSWLWRRVVPQTVETQPPKEQLNEMNLVTIENIVRQLDRYSIANAVSCPVGEIISAYETDFVFSCKKNEPAALMRVYNTALDLALTWPNASVFLITLPNDVIWENATSGGHPHNFKILVMTDGRIFA